MPDGKGRLILLLGPSGSGKDTLLDGLKQRFGDTPRVHIVQRAITRPPSPGTEDHLPLDKESFQALEATGHFAVTWQANGLSYALPREALDFVRAGGVAIANGSRGALADIHAAFGTVEVVLIAVAEDQLRQRLLARKRESVNEVEARLKRNRDFAEEISSAHVIDNSGPPEDAIRAICKHVESLLPTT